MYCSYMTGIELLVLAVGALFIFPLYWLFTRRNHSTTQKAIRLLLLLVSVAQWLVSLAIIPTLAGLLKESAGRFDDAMYGLTGFGLLSFLASTVTIIIGNLIYWGTKVHRPPKTSFICDECGQTLREEDYIDFSDVSVCARCKPIFFQKVKEGLK